MQAQLIFAAALLVTGSPAPAGPGLYTLSTPGIEVENGKLLDMRYKELVREHDWSIVEVTFKSGGSVSSSMFVLGASCGLLCARGDKFFRIVILSRQPARFGLDFPCHPDPLELAPVKRADKVFSQHECALLGPDAGQAPPIRAPAGRRA